MKEKLKKFVKGWKQRLENAETLFKMGKSPDGWFQSIVIGFRKACSHLKTQAKELKLFQRNFCEAHQPLPEDTYAGCYCCDAVAQAKQIEQLEREILGLMLEMVKGSKGERQRINAELLEKRREDFGIQKGD